MKMNGLNDSSPSLDWFGISTDPDVDPAKKCVFCKDQRRNPFEDPDSEANSHATTNCRHRVCGLCQKSHPAGQVKCLLCGSRIQEYTKTPPEFMALRSLNEVRKDIYKEWNLSLEDFNSAEEFNAFLEEREEMVLRSLYARTLEGDARNNMLQEIKSLRNNFKEKHKEAIHRNDARINEHRNQVRSEIENYERMVVELRKRIEREKREEEESRLRREEAMNDARLGTVRVQPTAPTKTRPAVVDEQKTYLSSQKDYGPLPTLVSKTGTAQNRPTVPQETVFRAGGLVDDVVHQRALSEMRAGWDLLF